jgi:gamma-glutamyltranspeptidase
MAIVDGNGRGEHVDDHRERLRQLADGEEVSPENQLTDFSFVPADAQRKPVANRVEPGKRPRSSMAPTVVFNREGQVEALVGSPGGSSIIQYVTKTLVGLIDW